MKKKSVGFDITKIIMAITAIAVVVMLGKGIAVQPIIAENNAKAEKIAEDIAKENQRIEEIDKAIQNVGTDEYIEKIAREKLGMIKADEIVFIDISGQ
ncbi:MAG: septum formation initiator family protein [Clostridia bacterium]|nr:septum formation initiator family protein [Clostridia bacterium]MBQ7751488.1 septum formation initiator family protein [Clostridia bacterium]